MKFLDYVTLLLLFFLFMFAASCSKDEVEEEIVIPPVENFVEDGIYAISIFDYNSYMSISPSQFKNNLLSYYPSAALKFKDSLVTEVMDYVGVSEYWNIDTNEHALKKVAFPRFASPEHIYGFNSTDSLPYVKFIEAVDKEVIKIRFFNPAQNKTEYALGYRLQGDKANTYIDDFYSNTGFFRDPIYSQLDPFDFKSLLRGFIEDARRHGVNPDYLDSIDIEGSNIILHETGGALAWVYGTTGVCSGNPTITEVHYVEGFWNLRDIYDKKAYKLIVMWHEFAHNLLQMAHWNAGGNIMTSNAGAVGPSNSCTNSMYSLNMNPDVEDCFDFERAIDTLFNHYIEFEDPSNVGWGQFSCN